MRKIEKALSTIDLTPFLVFLFNWSMLYADGETGEIPISEEKRSQGLYASVCHTE